MREKDVPHTNLHDTLGIRTVDLSPERVVLEVDVDPSLHQPFGVMHGGVSAVLAESAASLGAFLSCGPGEASLGIELNVSHLRARSSGTITATATPVRRGRTVHVWQVEIADEHGALVAVARCSIVIRPASGAGS